ncbi:MAG: hypothetical protein K6U09_01190 [Acidobacteriia bacterium]|jgi:hypothetical protein|nr:hypothetical protein [Terriglobia bacterium]
MKIAIQRKSPGEYLVTVEEAGSRTTHRVRVAPDYAHKLTAGRVSEEELVRRSFEFLLAREPKEQILGTFDLRVIARYFPEYEREIREALGL